MDFFSLRSPVGNSGKLSPLRQLPVPLYIFNMGRLDTDAFLVELASMYKRAKTGGSVTITMKRYHGRTKPIPRPGKPPLPEPKEFTCMIRAVLKTKKISTIVHQADLNKFQQAYSNLLKDNIDGLKKKKVKKSKNKAKATQ